MIRKGLSFPEPSFFCCIMELGYIPLVLFHAIIKKRMVNLLKEKLTANEIRCHRYDCITTMCRPSYIPAMHRIHGGTPATAVRSGSRPAPPDSRYLADQKGSGRPLRNRNQAMKNYVAICRMHRGRPNGRPAARFAHSPFDYGGMFLRTTGHEPRATDSVLYYGVYGLS